MLHVLHVVEKSPLLVHVAHPSILLLHSEQVETADLYFPDAHAAQLPLLTIYTPPHAVQVVVLEHVEQLP